MFIRKKINKSGTVSIQIIDRSRGRYKLVKTIGCSMDPLELDRLAAMANAELLRLSQPLDIHFDLVQEKEFAGYNADGAGQLRLAGPELVIGKLYDEIGLNGIKDEFFRHLVISRLCYPVNKLKVIDYLHQTKGVGIDAGRIFLYLERLNDAQKERVQEICTTHAKKIKKRVFREVYCYVAPLHYEQGDPDELKILGAAKEGRSHYPHMVFGLYVTADGDPLAYELFEGNKLYGQAVVQAAETFKAKFRCKRLVVMADSALFSEEHAFDLRGKECEYLLGAKWRNEDLTLQAEVLALKLKSGQSGEIMLDPETRLLVSYSREQAEKERSNHRKGMEKLKHSLEAGLLSRKNINNRGYNRYLKPTGKSGIGIDFRKFRQVSKWNGYRGILTNAKFSQNQMNERFDQLARIGKAFRISKTDLQSGSMLQQPGARIEAHFSIAFCAWKIFRELERIIHSAQLQRSAGETIEMAKSIFERETRKPHSGELETILQLENDQQRQLLGLFGL